MPFIRTEVPDSMPFERRQKVVMGIHQALVDSIGMPADELFNRVSSYSPQDFFYSRSFNGMRRSDQAVVVEITLRRGRSDAMKKALYAQIALELTGADVASDNIFIFMHENDYSDWSVGQGRFAMALVQQRGDAG
jgi:phenylpyruvate tautomerase PptA (4-oxalocrotonate tautomerase family)